MFLCTEQLIYCAFDANSLTNIYITLFVISILDQIVKNEGLSGCCTHQLLNALFEVHLVQ